MKKNYSKYFIVIGIIVLLLISYIAYFTYAKYITSISSDASVSIARWNITLNNQDISSGTSLSNAITPVFPGGDNIAPGVIAPTAEGYFDIVLDASNTDVSLRYSITTSENENSAVSDLIISGFSVDGGERQAPILDENSNGVKIENNILYNSVDKDISIRVYLKWNDDTQSGATMDNYDDANATNGENNKAIVNVNVSIVQIPNS